MTYFIGAATKPWQDTNMSTAPLFVLPMITTILSMVG